MKVCFRGRWQDEKIHEKFEKYQVQPWRETRIVYRGVNK
jgi:hypothetical protein